MKTIQLINCPPWGTLMPPLSIAYLSAYLQKHDIEVEVRDLNAICFHAPDGDRSFWRLECVSEQPPRQIAEQLFNSFSPQITSWLDSLAEIPIAGFSANNVMSAAFAGLCCRVLRARFPDKVTIVGGAGVHYSWDRNVIDCAGIDYFVIGEGEEPLLRLVQLWKRSLTRATMLPQTDIPGVISMQSTAHAYRPFRHIRDIDSIPPPTFSEFDHSLYGTAGESAETPEYRPLPVLMSRGCINRCSYCIDCHTWSPFRMRSPARVAEEIKQHIARYGTRHFELNDLLCNGDIRKLEMFCDILLESHTAIHWSSYAVIRSEMTPSLLNKLSAAGCQALCYGLESASAEVLKKMNKRFTPKQAAKVIRHTHHAGIAVHINIIVGFPGETEAEFMETVHFLEKHRRYIRQVNNVSAFVLMPDSDIYIFAPRFGVTILDRDTPGAWIDGNGLDQQGRNQRVLRMCAVLKTLAIPSLMVNMPLPVIPGGNTTPIRRHLRRPVPPRALLPCRDARSESIAGWRRRNYLRKLARTFFLFSLSFLMDIYLWILKRWRRSIIFPGA